MSAQLARGSVAPEQGGEDSKKQDLGGVASLRRSCAGAAVVSIGGWRTTSCTAGEAGHAPLAYVATS